MENVITNKEIFNERFRNESEELTIRSLLEFSSRNGFIDSELHKSIEENLKNKMLNFLVQNETKEDYLKDIQSLRARRMEKLVIEIVEFFVRKNDPYEIMNLLINGDIDLMIKEAVAYCKEMKAQLSNKVKYLVESDKYLIIKSYEYKDFIETVREFLGNYSHSDSCYSLLDGSNGLDFKNLVNLNIILDKAILESSILHKFAEKDVLRVVCNPDSIARNNADLVLTNYILASLYKEDAKNLKISDVVALQIENDIKNNMISASDMIDTIKDGEISFTGLEQDYIIGSLSYKFGENKLRGEYIRN